MAAQRQNVMVRGVPVRVSLWLLLAVSLAARAGGDPLPAEQPLAHPDLDTVTVTGRLPTATDLVSQRVAEAARLLQDVPLHYTYVKRFLRETLRGRPVAFAAWSERGRSWHVVEIEVPFPAPRLRPGKPLAFQTLTPGYQAVHVRGIGTERLMFDIYRGDEKLRVYGRKYPMIDTLVVKKQGIRAAVASAEVTHYLPLVDDAAPLFASKGATLLRSTAEAALHDLRESKVPSFAYPGKLLADTVLPETLMSLAVIEQTDDSEFNAAPALALNKTMGHYGLMQQQAFTYSVSSANAAGPMQFTDKRGRGTYSMVVRKCEGAELHPDFNTGARDLLNAMKAAACLLDMDMAGMPREVQNQFSLRPAPVSIFEVAAYNGGGRNASRLLQALRRLKGGVADLKNSGRAGFRVTQGALPLPVDGPQRTDDRDEPAALQPREHRLCRQVRALHEPDAGSCAALSSFRPLRSAPH